MTILFGSLFTTEMTKHENSKKSDALHTERQSNMCCFDSIMFKSINILNSKGGKLK